MSNNDYLTIAEYAKIKGITKQAVYKQLNNQLKEFLIVVEGKKYINKAALSTDRQPKTTTVEQPVEQPVEQLFNESLMLVIDTLKGQLEAKDRQIAEKDRQISELQALLSQSQQLQQNSQVLLLNATNDAPKPEEKEINAASPERKNFFEKIFKKRDF